MILKGNISYNASVQSNSDSESLESVLRNIRKSILMMIFTAGSGHLGASLSAVEIIAVLYFLKMKHNPIKPDWAERDRLVLSKGHAAPALYAILAESGYFPKEELLTLRRLGSRLQGHPDTKIPGVDAITGSLGQGLSIAVGMALAAKMDDRKYMIYVILGDGELNEGQIWEAAMTATHHGLDNLVAIVDRNGYQLTGRTEDIKSLGSIEEKWSSFGWETVSVDGHNPTSILDALDKFDMTTGKPSVIIAQTIKGKGISFMEGNSYSRKIPNAQEIRKALSELT
ncbi:transketolase [Candidatus Bathyarchaeota archaeon]|nr:transketolase [Candidatus Bathyarchaeota archaeon]